MAIEAVAYMESVYRMELVTFYCYVQAHLQL